MKCDKCNRPVFNESLIKMNEKGVFWCLSCYEKHEPAEHVCKFYVNADWSGYSKCKCGNEYNQK